MVLKGICAMGAALLTGAAFCCCPLKSDTFGSPNLGSGGRSIVSETQVSESKANCRNAADLIFGVISDLGGRKLEASGNDCEASLQISGQRTTAGSDIGEPAQFPQHLIADYSSMPATDSSSKETFSTYRLSGDKIADAAEPSGLLGTDRFQQFPRVQQVRLLSPPVKEPVTKLVEFGTSPFPYAGAHRPYNDRRVLLHIPAGFDTRRPAVMVLFFHGHGATLERDVRDRQKVPEQISASGMNAVLVAPQFAVDAADSSVGRFSEPGAVARFVSEAAEKLALLDGDPLSAEKFATMPIIIVGYSGGFLTTAYSLAVGGLNKNRVRSVVLLDAVYGELDKFARWIENNRSAFFVSSYTHLTKRHNDDFERILAGSGVPIKREISADLGKGSVTFVEADLPHRDYVTHAWANYPIKDILNRLGDYRLSISPTARASGPIGGPT